jgi:SUKH-3 immunity protein
MFTPSTEKLLRRAGWAPGRRFNVREVKARLMENGFSLHAKAEEFLVEFGGLEVTHPHSKVPDVTDRFKLDVSEALRMFGHGWVKDDYSRRVGVPLCVVGHAYNGYMVLAMAPDGSVYAGYDDELVRVGDSGVAALENLCADRDMEAIPD